MIPCRRLICLVVCLLAVLSSLAPAAAHTRSQSYSSWTVQEDTVTGVFRVDKRRITLLHILYQDDPSLSAVLSRHLNETVSVHADDSPCPLIGAPQPLSAAPDQVRLEMSFRCPGPAQRVRIRVGAFFPVSASHLHFLSMTMPSGTLEEMLLTERDMFYETDIGDEAAQAAASSFSDYLFLGAEHVLTGYDHLAFLAALVLLAGSVKRMLLTVTGFTLGHSVTLALAVLGYIDPVPHAVEALIGFSIAFAALAGLLAHRGLGVHDHRVALASAVFLAGVGALSFFFGTAFPATVLLGLGIFVYLVLTASHFGLDRRNLGLWLAISFGLVHGAGFAGILMEMDLPASSLVPALVGFNIGVELGQVGIVALAWGAFVASRRVLDPHLSLLYSFANAVLCGVGLYWFVLRVLIS